MGKVTDITKRGDGAPMATPVAVPTAVRFGSDSDGKTVPAEANAIGRWLQVRVLRAQRDPREGGCARLVIRHCINDKVADRVDQARLEEPGKLEENNIAEVALTVYKVAANDAENRGKGSPQKYMLQWFTDKDPGGEIEEPFVFPFTIRPGRTASDQHGGEYVESYPATAEGAATLFKNAFERAADKLFDVVVASAAPAIVMKDLLQQSLEDNAKLRQEIRDGAKAIDDARHAAWERNEDSLNNAAKRDMHKGLADGLMLLAPAVAKRVGLIAPDQPIAADNAHVLAVVQSLVDRDALGGMLASDLLTDMEKSHLVSFVTAHINAPGGQASIDKAVASVSGAPVPTGGNGKNGGGNGVAAGAVAPAPAAPPTPEQIAKALEEAEAQAEAWQIKAKQIKALVPVVVEVTAEAVAAQETAQAAPVAAAAPPRPPEPPEPPKPAVAAPKRKHKAAPVAPDGTPKA
jgi:hypothetical protein